MDTVVRPPPLDPGDRLAIVAPSSGGAASAPHIFELALERLESTFDVEPVVHPTARQSDEYLRAHPEARAAAIHESFKDPDIDAVMATIGGDDQIRVLDHLDPEVLRENPTRFFGLSDNTNLSLYLWNQGIASYTGVSLMSELGVPGGLPEFTERYLRRALFEETIGELEPVSEWADMTVGWDTPRDEYEQHGLDYQPAGGWQWAGSDEAAAGTLWGGSMGVVRWNLMADRYLPDPERLDGSILALETAEDLPDADRVRWTLQAMGERGLLQRFDGLVVGRPATQNWMEQRDGDERERYRQAQREAIQSQMERYNPDVPIAFDVDFGHAIPSAPVPVGGTVEIVAGETIRFR